MSSDASARIAELESELELHRQRWALNDEIDRLAEAAVRDRLPLDYTLRQMMPVLCRATGAHLAWIRTYDESLSLHDFVHGNAEGQDLPFSADELTQACAAIPHCVRVLGEHTLVAQPLEVAGDPFGCAAILVPHRLDSRAQDRAIVLLHTFCEEVDNTLGAIAVARKKTMVIEAMSTALREPVLDVGLQRALEVLHKNVPFEDLILVFRHEDDVDGRSLHYRIVRRGVLVHDSTEIPPSDAALDAFLRSRALALLAGDDDDVRERFGIRRYREEVLITGVRSTRVIGRLVISNPRGEFNTFDRDLLNRFADSLRQRLVDFHREWRMLRNTFAREASERLLGHEAYREKWLTPRERECAVMFSDISGFTRVCEQVLVRPEAIGRLVDAWSARVVEIVWENGGVFDKMVGDCAIGLWGPPFFDRAPKELCEAAITAAVRIRDFTRSLVTHEGLPELRGCEPLDVATGLNFCPLFVGIFGPDEDYTGFSAGMNNTARLQGQARGGEILCMTSLVDQIGTEADRFGEVREATAKNVAHPLRFRALRMANSPP